MHFTDDTQCGSAASSKSLLVRPSSGSFLSEMTGHASLACSTLGIETFRKRMANMKLKETDAAGDCGLQQNSEKALAGAGNLSLLRNADHLPMAGKRGNSPGSTPISPLVDGHSDCTVMTKSPLRSRPTTLRQHRPLVRYNSNPEPDMKNSRSMTSPPADHTHRRSQSCRRGQGHQVVRPQELDLVFDEVIRPRTSSVPSQGGTRVPRSKSASSRTGAASQGQTPAESTATGPGGEFNFYRVRSFTSTSRGIVNRGDSIKRKKRMTTSNLSIESTGSCPERLTQLRRAWSTQSQGSRGSRGSRGSSATSSLDADAPGSFRVLILGAAGVGKSALIQQFMTSEYMGHVDPCLRELILKQLFQTVFCSRRLRFRGDARTSICRGLLARLAQTCSQSKLSDNGKTTATVLAKVKK